MLAGYGLPIILDLQYRPWAPVQELIYWEGDQIIRRDITGQTDPVAVFTGGVNEAALETLEPAPSGPQPWNRELELASIHLRGLVPLAGNTVAAAGHLDGQGGAARFREPWGLVSYLEWADRETLAGGCLVADPQSHVIRQISADGAVTTPWGQPGQPGHRDDRPWLLQKCLAGLFGDRLFGPSRKALFQGPTFLCLRSAGDPAILSAWRECLVADSGNQVIRVLHRDGTASTLAGLPGQAGYRDGMGDGALFHDPQGLAEDSSANLYVADRGNCVIRRISRRGAVSTLAGSPGQAGASDGTGTAARFKALRGLAYHDFPGGWGGTLFVADGHGIRAVLLPRGDVITILGAVDTPGFRDLREDLPETEHLEALKQPCLNTPCGLQATEVGLVIADQGNHCVRFWSYQSLHLRTLAGDPALRANRWGLLRDQACSPLGKAYGSLEAPRGVAATLWGDPPSLLVTAGTCVAELSVPAMKGRERPCLVTLEGPPTRVGEPCAFQAAVSHRDDGRQRLPCSYVLYEVSFFEPDGSLADRQTGRVPPGEAVRVEGRFMQPGRGLVVFNCVTDQGVSSGVRKEVTIH